MKRLYFLLVLSIGLAAGVLAQIPVDTVTILDWDGNPLTDEYLYINVGETKMLQLDIRPANADPETMRFDIEVGDEDEELGYPVTIEGMSATAHRAGTRSLQIYVGQELKAAATLHSTYLKEYVVQAEGAGTVYCTINALGQLQFWAGAYDHPRPDPAYVAFNIPSFQTPEDAPWYDDREAIHEVLLDNVDSVGDYAFNDLDGIQSVSFPETFKSLGNYVFMGCHGLNTLEVNRYSYTEDPFITSTTLTSLVITNPDNPVRPNTVIVHGGEEMFEAYRSPDAEWVLCNNMTFSGGGIPGDTSSVHFEITPLEEETYELTIEHDETYEKPVVLDDRTEEIEYPWDAVGDQIEDLQVNDRVSYIGSRVFSELTNLQTIQFNQATDPLDSIHVKAFSQSITPWKFALGDPQDGPILPPKIAGDDGKALSQWLHFAENTVLYVPDSVFEYQGKQVRAIDLYRADPVWGQAFNRITDRTVDTNTSDEEKEVLLKWLPLENAVAYRLTVHETGCDECEMTFEIPATGVQGLVDWSQLEPEPEEDNPNGAPHRIRREDEHGGMTLTISIEAGSGTTHNTDVAVSITGMKDNAEYTFTREVVKSFGEDAALRKAGAFKIIPKVYTVTFKDYDGSTITTEDVIEGKAAEAPSDPTREGYHFTGWDEDFSNITADLTVTALYEINTYTVTFVDKDDQQIGEAQTIEWNEAATAPTAPAVEGYHFTGWDKAFDHVKSDLTVKAQYAINVYTVTFVDKDGVTLKTQSVEHGAAATAPDAPAVEGYHFTGWDKKFDKITSDLTVKALYAINVYTVTFVDKDGATLKTQSVEHGAAATAPDAPAVEGYHFTGWDKKFDNVTSDLTVKAQYAINVYTVTFVDKDGATLKTQSVEHGAAATAPDAPAVEGYHFTGWDKKFDKITSDLTVKAQYAINVYTVTFVDKDGATLKTQSVEHGAAATAPDAPAVEGYHFTGWDKKFDKVTSDLTVKAQYAINVYTVTFVDKDGATLKTQSVEHGAAATAPDAPAVEGYHFTGWDKAFDKVTSDLTVKALYAINTYTVTFVDYDNTELKKETVEHGKAATAPADPKREGYTFKGWDKDFSNITADLTVKAQYAINVYTVTFLDKDGNTLKTEKVEYGKSATAPEAPVIAGWTFAGWDKAFNVVKSDLTVQATYTKNPVYTVTFKDYDGSIIAEVKVEEGKSAVKPDDPIREGYTFTGWDKKFDNVTSDLTVTAQYTINVYTVTFVDKDGKTIKTEKVEWGKAATAPEAPAVEGYHFTGWDKTFDNVTSDLTVKAQYAINVYTVIFLDKDGNQIGEAQQVEYGQSAVVPEPPVVEGYTFLGWDKTCDYVTRDLTVQAQYLINLYAVTFIGFDGTILWSEQVEHGSAATAPEAPEVEGYIFIGWDKSFDNVTSDLTVQAIYEAIPDYTPQNLSVTLEELDDDLRITLAWDKVEGAASYDLQLLLGEQVIFAGNTFGMNVISLKLSEILQVATIEPGTYLIDWFVRSTDDKTQAISDWAQGEAFEITIKDPVQGIDEITNDQSPMTNTRKEMRNGLLYIIRNGHTYDSNGKLIE